VLDILYVKHNWYTMYTAFRMLAMVGPEKNDFHLRGIFFLFFQISDNGFS
jgi:hypothetical protein